MAQTISELEKERAELLKAIELQAQQLSSDRKGQDDSNEFSENSEHSLKDWLHAAEEVMPSSKTSQAHNSTSLKTGKPSDLNTRASFFGVIIMLSLLLTILGVVYIAYTAIQKELTTVTELNQKTAVALQSLQKDVTQLQEGMAGQGQGERFETLQNRVAELEKELAELKKNSRLGGKMSAQTSGAESLVDSSNTKKSLSALPDNVVTTDVLDAKLQEYTQGIERKLEQILKVLPAAAHVEDQTVQSTPSQRVNNEQESLSDSSDKSIAEPEEPHVKPMNQPVVRLVQKVTPPSQPDAPQSVEAPLEHYTSDVKWLQSLAGNSFTLQLASMSEESSLSKLVSQKGLEDTRIVPQDRNGSVRYVLITGNYPSRSKAENAAATLEAQFGISPWVRRVKDLTTKLK